MMEEKIYQIMFQLPAIIKSKAGPIDSFENFMLTSAVDKVSFDRYTEFFNKVCSILCYKWMKIELSM